MKNKYILGRAGVLLVGPQDARGRYPLYDGHQRANIWRTLYGADAEVHALQSNRELSEDERLSVSLLTVTAVGSLDFDALAGRRSAGTAADLTVVGPKANYHYGSDAHAAVGALAGCSVAGTPVDWDAMACNYTASDGSIKSVPLD